MHVFWKFLPTIKAAFQMSTSDVWLSERSFETQCGNGFGLAACPALGLLVTSDCSKDTLSAWRLDLHDDGDDRGRVLALVCTLGGAGSPPPMQFDFRSGYGYSGHLAFLLPPPTATAPAPTSLLLVSDHGHDAVHIVDVLHRTHNGYLAVPGSIAGPRGVATCSTATPPLVAISAWKGYDKGDHVIRVYAESGAGWITTRVIGGGFGGPGAADGQLSAPFGLRFSGDGSAVCVADRGNNRVSLFRVADGAFVQHIASEIRCPLDVEAIGGGWAVAHATVEFVGGDGRSCVEKAGGGDGEFANPAALALVPGLGLVVREYYGRRLQVFSTPDMMAMRRMAPIRVAWMVAAARAILCRSLSLS